MSGHLNRFLDLTRTISDLGSVCKAGNVEAQPSGCAAGVDVLCIMSGAGRTSGEKQTTHLHVLKPLYLLKEVSTKQTTLLNKNKSSLKKQAQDQFWSLRTKQGSIMNSMLCCY